MANHARSKNRLHYIWILRVYPVRTPKTAGNRVYARLGQHWFVLRKIEAMKPKFSFQESDLATLFHTTWVVPSTGMAIPLKCFVSHRLPSREGPGVKVGRSVGQKNKKECTHEGF